MPKVLDDVERDYLRAIKHSMQRGDNDLAYALATGLQEYRRYYKAEPPTNEEWLTTLGREEEG